jgi:hypothetical protein
LADVVQRAIIVDKADNAFRNFILSLKGGGRKLAALKREANIRPNRSP